jgi:hypothetical protein
MITEDAAKTLARQYLSDHQISFGDCVRVLEFPDGSLTLHFSRSDTRFIRDGNLVEVCRSPGTIVVMVDRKNSTVFMPDEL